jgi:hypothetical protein
MVLAKNGEIGQHLSAGKDGSRTRALSNRCSRLGVEAPWRKALRGYSSSYYATVFNRQPFYRDGGEA